MNSPSLLVSTPLTMRLLRRVVFVGALFVLLIAGVRAWWEYHAVLKSSQQLMAGVEQTMSASLAGNLRNFNVEQIEVQLETIRNTPSISYAAVLEGGRVLVESGAPKDSDVLERTTLLEFREGGGVRTLGELTLQVDLARVRGLALNAALVSLAFNSSTVMLLCLALFLITRGLVSRHLAAAAQHFRSLDLSGGELRLPELHFSRKWAGDELDILCLAVNAMQENLSATYAKARMAEQEARSQARFPQENPNPVLRVTAEGVLTSANQASDGFLAHVGCALGQRLPKAYGELLHEGFATGRVQRFEAEYDGRTDAFAAVPVLAEGYMNLYGMDITERKQASDVIARSLEEKEILLKEIHHRVKNNMQVISSLLFLQMEHVSNPADRALFAESQKRIQAMALVHEELYGSKDLSSVGMREYVPRLVDRVLAGADIPVSTEFELDEVRLPVTRSIPCGLALNELVMNAVKHGFRPVPGRAVEGRLRVALRRVGEEAVLEVEDNGPGLPPDFSVEASPTLGMTLVASLVRQLGGELTAKNAPGGGALFRLRFALDMPEIGPGHSR
jgi:two-component sensor histidine kinase